MKNYRSTLSIEIGVVILFIMSTTFMIFIGESMLDYFEASETMNKEEFLNELFHSFMLALGIDSGLIIIYYINKNRIKKGKKPI